MKLRKEPDYFLVTEREGIGSQKLLFIDSQLPNQMDKWEVRTKIASCFRILDDELHKDEIKLSGKSYIFFVGPVALDKLSKTVLKDMSMWLTYGAYNLIVLTQDEGMSFDFIDHLESLHVRYEKWDVNGNEIVNYKMSCHELAKRVSLSKKLFVTYEEIL